MFRFYWILTSAVAVIAIAWTVSAQPLPGLSYRLPPAPFQPPLPPRAYPLLPPPPQAPYFPMGPGSADAPGGLPPFPPGPPLEFDAWQGFDAFCLDISARRAANRAYLKAGLDLTERQLPAWKDFERVAAAGDVEERQSCSTAFARTEALAVAEQLDAAEERASRGLAHLRRTGAELRKLIATLSPEQLHRLDPALPLIVP